MLQQTDKLEHQGKMHLIAILMMGKAVIMIICKYAILKMATTVRPMMKLI